MTIGRVPVIPWWQRELWLCRAIRDFDAEHGYAPTLRELGELTERASTNTVAIDIARLARNGLITYRKSSPRTMQLTGAGIELAARYDRAQEAG